MSVEELATVFDKPPLLKKKEPQGILKIKPAKWIRALLEHSRRWRTEPDFHWNTPYADLSVDHSSSCQQAAKTEDATDTPDEKTS